MNKRQVYVEILRNINIKEMKMGKHAEKSIKMIKGM